jgi:S-adenosyl-L-methionine hydrolase (adenosine-forming)
MGIVTFLSDYGLDDDFVGVCHGVIARIAPDVRIIDITHGIGRQDVRSGALVLRRALTFMPAGVHLAVVDPGVGSARRAVALRCAGADRRLLVGPDNGLLWPAAQQFGGVADAFDLGRSALALAPVSASFHGRDVFAPVAAQLAGGMPLERAGDRLEPTELVALELPRARLSTDGSLVAHVLHADRFGNVMLDVTREQLAQTGLRRGVPVRVNDERATYATTFADVAPGGLLLYEDGYRTPSLAVNGSSARAALGLDLDDEVLIAPAR